MPISTKTLTVLKKNFFILQRSSVTKLVIRLKHQRDQVDMGGGLGGENQVLQFGYGQQMPSNGCGNGQQFNGFGYPLPGYGYGQGYPPSLGGYGYPQQQFNPYAYQGYPQMYGKK